MHAKSLHIYLGHSYSSIGGVCRIAALLIYEFTRIHDDILSI